MMRVLVVVLALLAVLFLVQCYKCRTPDCSELPPGGEYPDQPTARRLDAGVG